METTELIDALQMDGTRLADVADGLSLDAAIPTCPGWTVRDLLRHLAGVHRWAGTHVREARPDRLRYDNLVDLFGAWPADDGLVDWYRAEHALLVETLSAADPELACFTLLPTTSPRHFWARRQAHETTIHRVDVESSTGSVTMVTPAFAADGIDELVAGFAPRMRISFPRQTPRTLRIDPLDDPARWLIEASAGRVVTARETGKVDAWADCTARGPASDLYLALWNRLTAGGLSVEGDASLFDLFRESTAIR